MSCAQAPMGSGDENDLGTEVKSLSHIPRPYPGGGGGVGISIDTVHRLVLL